MSGIAKSGWLYRQSSVMKKWKRSWFVLNQRGLLQYYDNEHLSHCRDSVNVTVDCVAIQTGFQVENGRPPETLGHDLLICLQLVHGKSWVLCGESLDDAKAWALSLQEAKNMRMVQRPRSNPSAMYVAPTPAYRPTVYAYDDYYGHRRHYGAYPYNPYNPYNPYAPSQTVMVRASPSTTLVLPSAAPTVVYPVYPPRTQTYYYW